LPLILAGFAGLLNNSLISHVFIHATMEILFIYSFIHSFFYLLWSCSYRILYFLYIFIWWADFSWPSSHSITHPPQQDKGRKYDERLVSQDKDREITQQLPSQAKQTPLRKSAEFIANQNKRRTDN